MAKVTDLINSVGVGEDGISRAYPDTFIDDISAAYAEDMAIPDAAILVLETENAELKQVNTQLMAENYQLLKQIPGNVPGPDPEEEPGDSEPEEDPDDEVFPDDDDDNDK